VVIKEAMALVGRGSGRARAPIRGLTDGRRTELSALLAGIAEVEQALG
jgi:hypothetical protein